LKFIFLIKINLPKQIFVIMKVSFVLSITLCVIQFTVQYTNPFTNVYNSDNSARVISVPVNTASSGMPNYTYAAAPPSAASLPKTVATAPVQPVQTGVTHSHRVYPTQPVTQAPLVQPQPVVPTTPQNLTMQQIIQYLFSSSGSLGNIFQKGVNNFSSQCEAYCNALPDVPVCDTTNTLYRNQCQANCLKRTISSTNLFYNTCCCDPDEMLHATTSPKYVLKYTNNTICLPKCLYNCLGGLSKLDTDSSKTATLVSPLPIVACVAPS
jgi:hypothetical protein